MPDGNWFLLFIIQKFSNFEKSKMQIYIWRSSNLWFYKSIVNKFKIWFPEESLYQIGRIVCQKFVPSLCIPVHVISFRWRILLLYVCTPQVKVSFTYLFRNVSMKLPNQWIFNCFSKKTLNCIVTMFCCNLLNIITLTRLKHYLCKLEVNAMIGQEPKVLWFGQLLIVFLFTSMWLFI